MRPIPQESADLLTFAEEILNGKLHILRSVFFSQLGSTFFHHHKRHNLHLPVL